MPSSGIGSEVKALVFDTFGTVVDWRGSVIKAGEKLSREIGQDIDWTAFAEANPRNPAHALAWQRLEREAPAMRLRVVRFEFNGSSEAAGAIEGAARAAAGALLVLPDDPLMLNARPQIVAAAAKHRIPDFYWERSFVESGGLMSYGEDLRATYRNAAVYFDKIKKGARPAVMPVEQPTRFELVINAKTARALNVTVPAAMLVSADEVLN